MNRFGIAVAILILTGLSDQVLAAADAPADEPILEVDAGGHRAFIMGLLVTADGRELVSASWDGTIRIWDLANRREVRRILGEISPGYGEVNAIALSPDGRWLAVGGNFARDPQAMGALRIYDFASGRLAQVLRSHTDEVSDLDFSPDGRRLVSASIDRTLKVWDLGSDVRLERTLTGHTADVYAARFLPDGRIVSAGYDNQILLWDGDRVVARYRHDEQLKRLAVAPGYIAAVPDSGNKLLVFDDDLKLQHTLKNPGGLDALAVSRDGRWLAVGAADHPMTCSLYNAQQGFKRQTDFTKHDNVVTAIAFLPDGTLASGGGNNKDIYFWDQQGRELGHTAGQGRAVWAVGLDDTGLRWGHRLESDIYNNTNPLDQRLDLDTWVRESVSADKATKKATKKAKGTGAGAAGGRPTRIATQWSGDGHRWALKHVPGGNYGNQDATLILSRDGKESARITRGRDDGYGHLSYGFTADGTIVSSGQGGYLIAYARDGKELARFIGHDGETWSLATRDHWLLSGGDDQTLKLWNLDVLKTGSKEIQPALSVFPAADGEWVAWTPKGYYRASANGDRYVGFHVNHGPVQAAEYFPAARFRDSLNRPDILQLAWETGSETDAITRASQTRRTESVATTQLLPPRIVLSDPVGGRIESAAESVKIAFCVESQTSEPIGGIEVLLNGRPLAAARGLGRTAETPAPTAAPGDTALRQCRQQDIALAPDLPEQTITVLARNRYASANPAVVEVRRQSVAPANNSFKPDLYVLAVGVSHYARKDLDLGLAADDAQSLAGAFEGQKALFNRVQVRRLSDADASKDAVLDGLEWIDKESTQRDLAVIFLAGHGVNDDQGQYFFLPHDADPEHLRRSAVRWEEIKDVVTHLPGKVLLLADTCHSGNIMGGQRRAAGADLTAAIQSITSAGTGQVIMTAATGSSASLEDPAWGHGAFTKALLDGIAGQADFNHDGNVSVKELDLYVTQRVKELTDGRQKPTTILPESLPDFALSVPR